MSKDYDYDALKASRKGERRDKQRTNAKRAPIVARYGVWTGEGYLREGLSLEKKLAEQSLTLSGKKPKAPGKKRKRGAFLLGVRGQGQTGFGLK
jgi:hypothetical protein